jgi:Family of unknown function (DUF6510)
MGIHGENNATRATEFPPRPWQAAAVASITWETASEMTAANSTCGTCGTSRPVAELVVYRRAPGTVVRCRTCGSVLMVFVKAHDVTCVDLAGLASLGRNENGSSVSGG